LAHKSVRPISISSAEWQAMADRSPGATFFHTPIWAEAISTVFPRWRVAPVAVELSDGNLAVIPLVRYPLLGRRWEYAEGMVPGVYGGPIFLRPPTEAQTEYIWEALSTVRELYVTGNPFVQPNLCPPSRGYQLQPKFTHVLDLSSGPSNVERGYRKGHRADIRAALRHGVTVHLAQSPAEADAYFDVYQDSLQRWGKAASGFYPRRLFALLGARPEWGRQIKLWLAQVNEKIIAGIWVFTHRDHVVYWHAASLASHMALHPSHLLVATAIQSACEEGARWFDFNPSGGHPGVVAFKKGFGAQQLDFFVYRRFSPVGRLYRAFRYFKERYLRLSPL
jgi:hypothetical protein